MDCAICKKPIAGRDYDAEPVAKGRCCAQCHDGVVSPIRMLGIVKHAARKAGF